MDKRVLINECRELLNDATLALDSSNEEAYAAKMRSIVNKIDDELKVEAPPEPETPKQDGQP